VQDVLAGRVPAMMLDTATAQPHIQAGKLRPLAVASASRLPTYPDAPTLKELGYDVEVYAWQGLVVPVATPPAVRERLASELQKSLENPRVKAALTEFGLEVTPGTPAAMQHFIESETALWQALIRERGIRLEN
jgi:tripartite-type tricarboxylate transporter receptor subunit TctC